MSDELLLDQTPSAPNLENLDPSALALAQAAVAATAVHFAAEADLMRQQAIADIANSPAHVAAMVREGGDR
jgi:hypothetical protein